MIEIEQAKALLKEKYKDSPRYGLEYDLKILQFAVDSDIIELLPKEMYILYKNKKFIADAIFDKDKKDAYNIYMNKEVCSAYSVYMATIDAAYAEHTNQEEINIITHKALANYKKIKDGPELIYENMLIAAEQKYVDTMYRVFADLYE